MIIGLVGKTGSGKNYILKQDRFNHFIKIDLDIESSNIYNSIQKDIKKTFGTSDKKEIARIVFSDKKELKKLEDLIYPKLLKNIKKLIDDKKDKDFILNGATIFKSKEILNICNEFIIVKSSKKKRLKRIMERDNLSKKNAILRIKAQKDFNDKAYKETKKKITFIKN